VREGRVLAEGGHRIRRLRKCYSNDVGFGCHRHEFEGYLGNVELGVISQQVLFMGSLIERDYKLAHCIDVWI